MSSGANAPLSIKPFKNPEHGLGDAYFLKQWEQLRAAFELIFRSETAELSYEALYRTAYNLIYYKHGPKLYDNIQSYFQSHFDQVNAAFLAPPQPDAAAEDPFATLSRFLAIWRTNRQAIETIHDVLMYFDRTFVASSGRLSVRALATSLFASQVALSPETSGLVRKAFLRVVASCRSNPSHDLTPSRATLRDVLQLFLGFGRATCREHIEDPYLREMEQHYKAASVLLVSSAPPYDYLRQVQCWVDEEGEIAAMLEDPVLESRIMTTVKSVLIAAHMSDLANRPDSGMFYLFDHNEIEKLRLYCALFRLVPKGQATLQYSLSSHLESQLSAARSSPTYPRSFIAALLKIRARYEAIIERAFGDEQDFKQVLHLGIAQALNADAMAPEYLCTFIHDVFRRSSSSSRGHASGGEPTARSPEEGLAAPPPPPAAIPPPIDRALFLFRYIAEKDIFERCYKQYLAKRLLRRMSDVDIESAIIARIRVECGSHFTSKFEGMIKDVKTSAKMTEAFEAFVHREATAADDDERSPRRGNRAMQQPPAVDLQATVLTSGFWPTISSPLNAANRPPDLAPAIEGFERFYDSIHSGRRLAWQALMGSAELVFWVGRRRRRRRQIDGGEAQDDAWKPGDPPAASCHLLSLMTPQMLILLQFNQCHEMHASEIAARTGLAENDASRHLDLLLRHGVLTQDDRQIVAPTNALSSECVRITSAAVRGGPRAAEPTDDHRRQQIEAAIVRVMKQRRRCAERKLIRAVSEELASQLAPKPEAIRARIRGLIQREYLAEENGMYQYLA